MSALSWTNKLPKHWKVVPLKAVATYMVSSVDKLSLDHEIPIELCNYVDVYKNDFIDDKLEFMVATATQDEINKYQLKDGDVLITKDSESWDDIGIPSLVTKSKSNLLCGYHLAIIRSNKNKLYPQFLFHCIQSKEIRLQLELASTGVTRFGLPKGDIGSMLLPIPDIHIQISIATYIDKEIIQIDKLIKVKKDLLDKLSEKRKALIAQVVTKGLNSKTKIKESGIDWLGEVPLHWDIVRLKHLGRIVYGLSQPPEYINEGTPLIRATNVYRGAIQRDGLVFVDGKDIPSSKKIILDENDIIVVRSGAYTGDSAIITKEWKGAIAGFDMIFKHNELVNPEYLATVLLSEYVLNCQLIPASSRAAQPHLNAEELGSVTIALPPLNEQKEIIDFLKKETDRLLKLETLTTKSIFLMYERRSVLVAEAVTGQLKL